MYMSQEIIESLVTDVLAIGEEWETAPARKMVKERIIDFARNVFYDAALYGYDNGLFQKQIDIKSEMDKRGFLTDKNAEQNG